MVMCTDPSSFPYRALSSKRRMSKITKPNAFPLSRTVSNKSRTASKLNEIDFSGEDASGVSKCASGWLKRAASWNIWVIVVAPIVLNAVRGWSNAVAQ